jgi:uncharacterized ubiquitin-like protein YukD
MGEVVCTLVVNGKQSDLVLPDNVPVHLLTRSICSALKLQVKESQPIELYLVENTGDLLIRGSRTLSQARILNGSFLRLTLQAAIGQKTAFLLGPRDIRFQLYSQNKIGRSSQSVEQDIDLSPLDLNTVVSHDHAVIEFRAGQYWIYDQKSKNGTFVNGKQVFGQPVPLRKNDVLHFGSEKRGVKLIFVQM